MSSAASTGLTSLSVLFIGFIASAILYGLTCFQLYIYFGRFPKDHWILRWTVAMIGVIDTAASILMGQILYYYLVILYDVNTDMLPTAVTFIVENLVASLSTMVVRVYYARRVWQVTAQSWTKFLLIFIPSLGTLATAAAMSEQMSHFQYLTDTSSNVEIISAFNQAFAVVADVILAWLLCFYMRRKYHPDMLTPEGWSDTLFTFIINRGVGILLMQLTFLCVALTSTSKELWIPFHLVTSKCYIYTMIGTLNARDAYEGRGINEEETLAYRPPTDGPNSGRLTKEFSSPIRFYVADSKSTENTDTEVIPRSNSAPDNATPKQDDPEDMLSSTTIVSRVGSPPKQRDELLLYAGEEDDASSSRSQSAWHRKPENLANETDF